MPHTEIMDRYRSLRAVSSRHHSGAFGCLARQAVLEQAKYLGLSCGRTLVAECEEEMTWRSTQPSQAVRAPWAATRR